MSGKTKKITMFSVALAAVMALVFFLATSLSGNEAKPANDSAAPLLQQAQILIGTNEKLQQRLASLQQLDQQYAASITNAAFAATSDSLNKLILQEEMVLQNATEAATGDLDSITDETIKTNFEKMLIAYNGFVENRKAISILRGTVAMQSSTLAPDEKAMLQLQQELMEKNSQIVALEKAGRGTTVPRAVVVEKGNDAALQQNIEALESKVALLTANNNNLKHDNEKLAKGQSDATKNAGASEQMLKEKNTQLQQKLDDLNAEIQLVKVDCNLNRVDATKIISNAKQRKQLLNEASDILTGLSATGNTSTKNKVKEKINRLNMVAANSRE